MRPTVLAILLAAMVGAGGPAATQAPDELVTLEEKLQAKPDDLRAGNEYRMAVMRTGQYDRGLAFFQRLVAAHPSAANARLHYGFQYVDKIPVAGSITQVILANNALTEFSKSLELKPSWIGYYTRGNSYLFWPRIFNRTRLGLADLQEALRIQRAVPRRSYHARTFIALGDAHWKSDEFDRAAATWKEGLAAFPGNAALRARLSKQGEDLKTLIEGWYDPSKRVDSSLGELWADE